MSIRTNRFPIPRIIRPQNVLISVFDKSELDVLVPGLLEFNPEVMFFSTGGTGERVREILGGNNDKNYVSVESFTAFPEMEGGLVKTLHPKIHAGLLAERGNPAHLEYVRNIMGQSTGAPGVYFDVAAVNLYPFGNVVSGGAGPEEARVNVDIGGPGMIRAGAKNWHSVAVLSSPTHYSSFLDVLHQDGGIPAVSRFSLAREAFRKTARYEATISSYFSGLDFARDVAPELTFCDEE